MKVALTRPMLAEAVAELAQIKFPALLTPKIDGVRCLKVNGKAVTRKFLPFPNEHIRSLIERHLPDGVDGELIVPGNTFSNQASHLMSEDGEPDFEYCLFDFVTVSLEQPYKERALTLKQMGKSFKTPFRVQLVLPQLASNLDEFLRYEETCLKAGYEGVIIRSVDGPYKCGRATLNQGYMLKWKRFTDSEAQIIGFIEAMENTNEAKTNELGLTKRSHAKAGKVPKGILGAFKVKDIHTGVEFEIGTGIDLTQELRRTIWNNQKKYTGKIINYQYQECGVKDKPRFPSYRGFRDASDL